MLGTWYDTAAAERRAQCSGFPWSCPARRRGTVHLNQDISSDVRRPEHEPSTPAKTFTVRSAQVGLLRTTGREVRKKKPWPEERSTRMCKPDEFGTYACM